MIKKKTIGAFAAFVAVLVLALGVVLLSLPARTAKAENTLVMLDGYTDYAIPENLSHDAEYSINVDANKRLDYGIRKPAFDTNGNFTSVLAGDPLTHPGSSGGQLGNGVNVDYGVSKLKMTYAGGGARFRYGYGVDLSDMNINVNFLDLDGVNGHLAFTFSNNYDAIYHPHLNNQGVNLVIYQDSPTVFQSAILSAHNSGAVEGLQSTNNNNNVGSFAVSASDPETYCFSIYTFKNEDGSYSVQVINKNAQITYTLPASLSQELVIGYGDDSYTRADKGQTNIGINAMYDWDDNSYKYITYVIEIKDPLRTAYEESILNPVKQSLEEYLKVLDETSVSTMSELEDWLAKRSAIDMNKAAQLRIADRDFMQLNAKIAQANAKLKELAGSTVNTYISGRISELDTEFATAEGENYTSITTQAELQTLTALYNDVKGDLTQKYSAVITCTEEEKTTYNASVTAAGNALEKLSKHIAIYAVEHAEMDSAEKLVEAKAAYAAINTDAFKNEINALVAENEVKSALLERLSGIADIIARAEAALDAASIIGKQIENYETAPIGSISEIRAALAVKALIDDYSSLEEAEAFSERIAARDAAVRAAAWTFVETKVNALNVLTEKGIGSYRERCTLAEARDAVTDIDLLSEEKQALADAAISAATALVREFDGKLDDSGWILYSGGVQGAQYGDIALTEKGVVYTTNGQNAVIYTQAFDLSKGIEVVFTAKQWGYIAGDGTAAGSNNSWICFSDKVYDNGRLITRNSAGSMSVMYWQASESFTKAYYNTDDDVSSSSMTTIPKDAKVVVRLNANDAKKRFEIETVVYDSNDREITGCYSLMLLPYNDTYSPELYADGIYVSFSCYMDTRENFYNIWEIQSVGTIADEPDNPDNPENPDNPDNPDNPENPDTPIEPEPPSKKGCGSSVVVGSAVLSLALLAAAALLFVKKKTND